MVPFYAALTADCLRVIETEFGLFEMQREGAFSHPMKLGQAVFGVASEALDSVDMIRSQRKFVFAMIDSAVSVIAEIDKPVVSSPAIGMDQGFQTRFTANDGL